MDRVCTTIADHRKGRKAWFVSHSRTFHGDDAVPSRKFQWHRLWQRLRSHGDVPERQMPVRARERGLTCGAASNHCFLRQVAHSRLYPGAERSSTWASMLEFRTIDRDNRGVSMTRGGETMEKFSPLDERPYSWDHSHEKQLATRLGVGTCDLGRRDSGACSGG